MNQEMKEKVEQTIKQSKIFLMMKGTPEMPQCGFSNRVVQILKKHGVEFSSLNIFENIDLMDAIKEYADWPTSPQLWVNGKFVGGCDIVESLDRSGELKEVLG